MCHGKLLQSLVAIPKATNLPWSAANEQSILEPLRLPKDVRPHWRHKYHNNHSKKEIWVREGRHGHAGIELYFVQAGGRPCASFAYNSFVLVS